MLLYILIVFILTFILFSLYSVNLYLTANETTFANDNSETKNIIQKEKHIQEINERKLKIRSTKTQFLKISPVNQSNLFKPAPSTDKNITAEKVKKTDNASQVLSQLILWILSNIGYTSIMSSYIVCIINDYFKDEKCVDKISFNSLLLGGLIDVTPDITETSKGSFSCDLIFPKVPIVVMVTSAEKDEALPNNGCVSNNSEKSTLTINAHFHQDDKYMSGEFTIKMVPVIVELDIGLPSMDQVMIQSVKDRISTVIQSIAWQFEIQLSNIFTPNCKELSDDRLLRVNINSPIQVSLDPLRDSLVDEQDQILQDNSLISLKSPTPMTKLDSGDRLLTINYLTIPLLMVEPHHMTSTFTMSMSINIPWQIFQCQITSFTMVDGGLEDVFVNTNATFIVNQQSTTLSLTLRTDNDILLRYGEMDLTSENREATSFFSIDLHAHLERNGVQRESSLEFVTLSAMYSAAYCQTDLSYETNDETFTNSNSGYNREREIFDDGEFGVQERCLQQDNTFDNSNSKSIAKVKNHFHIKSLFKRRIPSAIFRKCKRTIKNKINFGKLSSLPMIGQHLRFKMSKEEIAKRTPNSHSILIRRQLQESYKRATLCQADIDNNINYYSDS